MKKIRFQMNINLDPNPEFKKYNTDCCKDIIALLLAEDEFSYQMARGVTVERKEGKITVSADTQSRVCGKDEVVTALKRYTS